jgi:hypothetical protein
VKGEVKTQVLVIKEGAFFEGAVLMARKTPSEGAAGAADGGSASSKSSSGGAASADSAPAAPASSSRSAAKAVEAADAALFSAEVMGEPASASAGSSRQPTGPGDDR